jgi:preprotein translocase subunit SecY
MEWLNKIIRIFKLPDLRNKILFVLGVFVVFRIMANIPMPGVEAEQIAEFFENLQVFGMLDLFVGGTLSKLSIVMLGLGPYITATIIMQLLTMIFPALERLYKEEGEAGRRKFNQYGRILAVPLALLQGYAMLSLLQQQGAIGQLSPEVLISALVTIAGGCIFLMWLGELISEKGIGNGISLLIFAGIIAIFPANIGEMFKGMDQQAAIPAYFLFAAMSLLIIAGVVMVNQGRRNIPVSYAKRVRGMKMYGGVSTYLPLNVNPAGVIPIIFAFALMMFPGMVASVLSGVEGTIGNIAQTVSQFFEQGLVYLGFLFILVILFTFFYTAVTFDPKAISNNLQKMGGFVPGIRPGESTAKFLRYILNRILVFGALFLATIAVLPTIVPWITGSITGIEVEVFNFFVGGTSLLIIVNVVLETLRQINSQLQMREYETL